MSVLKSVCTQIYDSPCGKMILGSSRDALCLCNWLYGKNSRIVHDRLKRLLHADFVNCPTDVTMDAAHQLDSYFAGDRKVFDVPLLFTGTTFQITVWKTLLQIHYGTTVSYSELSRNIGMPDAVRAVANANGANAISIFVPCHRVIGRNGSLTGYAGGLDAKKFLLDLEKAYSC